MNQNKIFISILVFIALVIVFFIFNSFKGYLGSPDHIDRVYLSRSIFYLIIFQLAFMAVLFRSKTANALKKYFAAESHPLNLAVFRIIIFSSIMHFALTMNSIFFSGLPEELLYPPPGLENVVKSLPLNPQFAKMVRNILCVSAAMAVAGLWTRLSASVAIFTAVYYLGIPQLYGKVNHNHFLIWFGSILAVSPCADTLSMDAIVKGCRNAKKGLYIAPTASREYGLPIRLIFIIFGVLYFFPGFWKFYICGFEWFTSNNLIHLLYNKWYELDGWQPLFRVDRYPFLCHVGAAMTIFFEMSFIFLIFFDKWRYLAVFNGLFFHNMTGAFMHITFISLQRCYVIFVDWHKLFSWIGKKIFDRPIRVITGNDTFLTKLVPLLKAFDLFEQTEYHGKQASDILAHHGMTKQALCVLYNNEMFFGIRAWLALSLRNPILWGLVPVLWMLPKSGVSANEQSVNAAEHVRQHVPVLVKFKSNPYRRGTRTVAVVASFFIMVNLYCGFARPGGVSSWPFSAFPHFAVILEQPLKTSMELVLLDEQEREITFDQKKLVKDFGSDRYWGLVHHILSERDSDTLAEKILSLARVVGRSEPAVSKAKQIQIYMHLHSTLPEDRGKDPVQTRLLLTVKNIKKLTDVLAQ